jgi:formyl-CoA transferase
MRSPHSHDAIEAREVRSGALLPLAGVRVVDLARVMTRPFCTTMLADMGAEVIKIERPGTGDDTRQWGPPFFAGEAAYYLSVNRNKRSIAIDLKSDGGKEILWTLIAGADVLVENFSPGTIDRLGFGYEAVRARSPEIVYCSISGFGQTGPGRDHPAYDLIIQGLSGLMSITGPQQGPPTKVGIPISDIAAGMFAAYAIIAALYRRDRTGAGEYIDASLLGTLVTLMTYHAVDYFMTGMVPGRTGNAHPMICPYDTYLTQDGYVVIAVGNDTLWDRFCRAIGWERYICDPRYARYPDRVERYDEVTAMVTERLRWMTTAETIAVLEGAGVPWSTRRLGSIPRLIPQWSR